MVPLRTRNYADCDRALTRRGNPWRRPGAPRRIGRWNPGFWAAREHRGRGYVVEATLAACRWAFTEAGVDRVEWRAEVGNHASRAVAERAGFTVEGVLRSGVTNKGVRRDCWVGSLLPSDLGLPSTAPYLPARP